MSLLEHYSREQIQEAIAKASPEEAVVIRQALMQEALETDYETWLYTMFPRWAKSPLGPHHHELWKWGWAIEPGVRPPAFCAFWNRGGAKSSSAELLVAALGARGLRNYVLYVGGTQQLADDHVGSIGAMLESDEMAHYYPAMAQRSMGKFGSSKGWRRDRLRTASGFTVDAIGLDTAARGVKMEDQRPNIIVLDDIDETHDTPETVAKKISTIVKGLIPAGSEDVAILFVQNLIHSESIAAQMVDGRADFLQRRITSGPIPALWNFEYEKTVDGYRITSGEPTWEGFPVERCELLLNDIGPDAFETEAQHNITTVKGAKWSREQLTFCTKAAEEVPDLEEVMVFVDPSGGETQEHDEQGIIAGGRDEDGNIYVFGDLSGHYTAGGWGNKSVVGARVIKADIIGVEDNYGGEMTEYVIKTQMGNDHEFPIKRVNARRGKMLRAAPVAALFGSPDRPDEWHLTKVFLVGALTELRKEMTTYTGKGKSPNRLDAFVHLVTHLAGINDDGSVLVLGAA